MAINMLITLYRDQCVELGIKQIIDFSLNFIISAISSTTQNLL